MSGDTLTESAFSSEFLELNALLSGIARHSQEGHMVMWAPKGDPSQPAPIRDNVVQMIVLVERIILRNTSRCVV
jgi:hypothetical protein